MCMCKTNKTNKKRNKQQPKQVKTNNKANKQQSKQKQTTKETRKNSSEQKKGNKQKANKKQIQSKHKTNTMQIKKQTAADKRQQTNKPRTTYMETLPNNQLLGLCACVHMSMYACANQTRARQKVKQKQARE